MTHLIAHRHTQTFSLGLYIREGNESVSVSSSCDEEESRIGFMNYAATFRDWISSYSYDAG